MYKDVIPLSQIIVHFCTKKNNTKYLQKMYFLFKSSKNQRSYTGRAIYLYGISISSYPSFEIENLK